MSEDQPKKYVLKIAEIKLQRQTPDGLIVNMQGTTFDLAEMVINQSGLTQGGLPNTEIIKRGKLWDAIDKHRPEGVTDPAEIIKAVQEVELTENQWKYFVKLVKAMRWHISGKGVRDFIVEIVGDVEED